MKDEYIKGAIITKAGLKFRISKIRKGQITLYSLQSTVKLNGSWTADELRELGYKVEVAI